MASQDKSVEPPAEDANPYRSPREVGIAARKAADGAEVIEDYPASLAWHDLNHLWFVRRPPGGIEILPRKGPVYVCCILVVAMTVPNAFLYMRISDGILLVAMTITTVGCALLAAYLRFQYRKGPWLKVDARNDLIQVPRQNCSFHSCDCLRWDLVSGWRRNSQKAVWRASELYLVARAGGGGEAPLPIVASESLRMMRKLCEELSALTNLPMRNLKLNGRR